MVELDEGESVFEAAGAGNALAQNEVGLLYATGKGVAKDEKAAVEWFRKAAVRGVASAQYNLGTCYYEGKGIAQDYKAAVEWYCKAAKQGDASAQYSLAVCYSEGRGVEKDEKATVQWLREAAKNNLEEARRVLKYHYKEDTSLAALSGELGLMRTVEKGAATESARESILKNFFRYYGERGPRTELERETDRKIQEYIHSYCARGN